MSEITEISSTSTTHPPSLNSKNYQFQYEIHENISTINTLLQNINKIKSLKTLIAKNQQSSSQQSFDKLITKYNPKYTYKFQPYQSTPQVLTTKNQLIKIKVECRNNWIQQYLDKDKQHIAVYGYICGRVAKILGQSDGTIKYNLIDNYALEQQEQKIMEISLKQFYAQNKQLDIQFLLNRYFYRFQNNLMKLKIEQNNNKKQTIIVQAKNLNNQKNHNIRRVFIFKLHNIQLNVQANMICYPQVQRSEYNIYDGFYQDHDFLQPVQLQAGEYIFMPFPGTSLNLYTTQLHSTFQIIQAQYRKQINEYNMFLQAFPECHPNNIKAQYTLQCDLNKGILIQIYCNTYSNEIYFQDMRQYMREDKQLMFKQLYSKRDAKYRLKKGQVIIQFYQMTSKPAVLYQPQKKVMIDKEVGYQTKTMHAILK